MRRVTAAVLGAAVLAGTTSHPLTAAQEADSSASAAQERFENDVQWLAADEREGRGVGTNGLTEAAHWLAGRFGELGLRPAGDSGGFLQTFSVRLPGEEIHNVVGIVESAASDRLPGSVLIGATMTIWVSGERAHWNPMSGWFTTELMTTRPVQRLCSRSPGASCGGRQNSAVTSLSSPFPGRKPG